MHALLCAIAIVGPIGVLTTVLCYMITERNYKKWKVQYEKNCKELGEDAAFYIAYFSMQ